MVRIEDKMVEVEKCLETVGSEFFGNRYKRDREWWVLGSAARLLKADDREALEFAAATEPPLPDFCVRIGEEVRYLEVVEALLEGRKRHEEIRAREAGALPAMWTPGVLEDPFSTLRTVVSQKLKKAQNYPDGSWLLILFSIGRLQMPGPFGISWEELLLGEVQSWTNRSLVPGFSSCGFSRVLVLDSSGKRLVSIFPELSVISK